MANHRLDGGLGFKSLHDFNLAMLGKQGWNIINRPHSLVARVLKARYFPTTSFFEASLGHNPSFLWRSIWATQSLVKAGAYLRIGNGRWNESLIAQLFNDRDRSCILNIPLSLSSHPDVWCWKFASKGHYSVKSAYRFLVAGFRYREGSEIWSRIWKTKVPPKVLNFCWRALVNCPFARSCWLSSPLGWPAFSAASLREWFSLAFLTASAENASLILMICWALWHNRNNQWRGACSDSTSYTNVVSALTVWSPPPQGWIKVNIDASLNSQRSSLGFGCVVRNANDRFIAAKAGCFCSQMEVKCAEAVAFREALSWIKECGWDQVLFESDAQVLIVSINNASLDDLSPFGLLIQDCKLLLSSYEEARCAFIHRSANDVAHVLTTSTHSESGQGVLVHVPPSYIVSLIALS
ncbi:uncharacterized protein LOC110626663 [Manihot esculenta]|uniref:uncharacterized protein LOC110626663 n=1 Tax=Manihot esculenta TaxID=3983 RepID=UPI001CC58F76|nr:uncharacterized protein LOC110626663 [Manihot esculenta]